MLVYMEIVKGQQFQCSIVQTPLDLASFPGPTKERRGPGTHCLRMCRVPQKKWGTGYHRILSIQCIFRIRSPLTHSLLLLCWQNI